MSTEHRYYTTTINHSTEGTLQIKQLFETFRDDPDKPPRSTLLYIPAEYKVQYGIANVKLFRRGSVVTDVQVEMRPECRLTPSNILFTDYQVSRPVDYDSIMEPSVVKHIPRQG